MTDYQKQQIQEVNRLLHEAAGILYCMKFDNVGQIAKKINKPYKETLNAIVNLNPLTQDSLP